MNDFFDDYDNDSVIETTKNEGGRGGDSFAEEIMSRKIRARSRTYYIDLKQSMYGKFVKISEKSNGRKTTVMIDAENIDEFIQVLEEMKKAA